ncbi:MAG: histidine triad nucleotide-binding protein [Acidobacteriaceae bacterium]|nr:histidine triad nucleotide-binding protein [Acidobacteriaceae bacterium]
MDCLFCKIVEGVIPVTRLYEDEQVLAFPDIQPQAPTHILVIPKKHIASHAKAVAEDKEMLGHLMFAVGELAREKKLDAGYRLVINTGPDGGQTVDHMHVHLLGGRAMHWPPG